MLVYFPGVHCKFSKCTAGFRQISYLRGSCHTDMVTSGCLLDKLKTFIMKSAQNEWLHYLQTRREESSLMSFNVLLCHIWSKMKKYLFELISLLPLSSTPCFFWDQRRYRWSLPASLGSRTDQASEHSAQCGVAESPECVGVSLISWLGCSSPCLRVDCFQLSVWFASESGEQLLPLCGRGHVRFHSISSPLQHDVVLQANRYKGYNLP